MDFKPDRRGTPSYSPFRESDVYKRQGEAVISHRLKGFEPYAGEIEMRINGSLIAMETGDTFAYAINKLQDRGKFFIAPGDEVYAGQVIGESTRQDDIVINVCKSKKLTNMRASGSDEKTNIAPPILFSLEEALEYIKEMCIRDRDNDVLEQAYSPMTVRFFILQAHYRSPLDFSNEALKACLLYTSVSKKQISLSILPL